MDLSKDTELQQLRKDQYNFHYSNYPYLKSFKKNPYTYLKAIFYMELSAILVYFLLKTKIKPNTVTLTYGLLGLLGGILLTIPTNETIFIAIIIFFSKGILDWSDGHYARKTSQTSITGDILDHYGAFLGALGFQIGLGFYVAQKSDILLFYFLIPFIPLFYAGKLHSYSLSMLFKKHFDIKIIKKYIHPTAQNISKEFSNIKSKQDLGKKYSLFYNVARNLLDDRARTVDFICLLLILEMFTPIFFTWIIFLGFAVKGFLLFSASLYIVIRKDWTENEFKQKIAEISKAFDSIKKHNDKIG